MSVNVIKKEMVSTGQRDDITITVMSQLVATLSREWPLDIIMIIVGYAAQNRSLVVCGGSHAPYYNSLWGFHAYHQLCFVISPFITSTSSDTPQWRLLPSLPKTDNPIEVGTYYTANNQLILNGRFALPYQYEDNIHRRIAPPMGKELDNRIAPSSHSHVGGIVYESSWKTIPITRMVSVSSYICVNNILYQFGNDDPKGSKSASYIVMDDKDDKNTTTASGAQASHNQWISLTPMSIPRSWSSVCQWRNRLYIIGGDRTIDSNSRRSKNAPTQMAVTNHITCLDLTTKNWIDIPNGGGYVNRCWFVSIGDDRGILLGGGLNDLSHPHTDIEFFAPLTNEWTMLSLKLPFVPSSGTRTDIRVVYINGFLCILGHNNTAHVWCINIGHTIGDLRQCRTDQWFRLPDFPLPMNRAPAVFVI
jgi:hypothetical protein